MVVALAALAPLMLAAAARKTHKGHRAAHAIGHGTHTVGEDSIFYEGTPFQNPAPVSPEVLRVLARTDEAKDVLDSAAEAGKVDSSHLFRAREVHLNHGKDVDLVVIGTPPKPGLDPNWFWVVRSARRAPQVVLYAGSGALKLLESRTSGYRDILLVTPVASRTRCVTYRFDGNQYNVWQEKWADSTGPHGLGCEGR